MICDERCIHGELCEGRHEVVGEHWAWTDGDRELHVWTAERECDARDDW